MSHDAPLRRGIRAARDYLHYLPRPGFRAPSVVDGPLDSDALAARLDARGIEIVPGAIAPGPLAALQTAFEALFVGSDGETVGATAVPGTLSRNIDLAQSPAFLDLALNEAVLAAAARYFGRPLYLAAVQANRLEPVEPFEGDSYQWHHDAKGKYVKAMWLLSDVAMDGQRMSYVAGSHRRLRVTRSYEESRLSDAEARASGGAVVECVGSAGTLVLFDSNGIHRGNRNRTPRRDVVFAVYSAGRHLEGCRVDPASESRLSPFQRRVIARSRRVSKGYERTGP